jgi:ATP-binding cassette subfamily B protein
MASDSTHPPLAPARGLLRWLGRYALRRWVGMVAVLSTMLLKIAIDLLRPWPMKVLIDYVLEHKPIESPLLQHLLRAMPLTGSTQQLIAWCVGGTVVVFLLAWTVSAAAAMAGVNFGQRLAYDLAADLFTRLQQLSLRFHARRAVGDSIRRVLVDSSCVSTIVKDAMIPVVTSAVTLVVMFIVLWRLDARLAVVSLAVVPMMAWTFRWLAQPMVDTSYRQYEADAKIYAVVERTLSAIPAVQAFCRESEADREFRAATDATLAAALVATDVQLKFKICIGFATAIGTAAMLWLGAHEVLAGRMTVGSLLVFLSYLASLYSPLEVLAYTSSTVQGAAGSARRVLEVLNADDRLEQRAGARALGPIKGHIRFESVTVGYEPDRPVLHDLSLDVRAGETIAIVGPTGAGKSTLVGLVPRFADPWQGRIVIDDQDLRDLTLASLRQQVSLVLQEPFLFPLSIAENIAYGRPSATQQAIEDAARAANAHEFITSLPDGYQTVVGERGCTLSGGERQRISIARALLKDAPVLILDEPTASLDTRTESLVLQALNRLQEGRTTLVIAHRLSTIRNADRIVVLDAGRIVGIGTHEQLLSSGGLYAALHAKQFGGAN